MAVFRIEKNKNYTVMSNYHLRDKNLTLKAKGLLSWMLSNTEDWDYSVDGIVAVMKESRDAINSALTELEDYGYLTRNRIRDSKGTLRGVEYIITELPNTENPMLDNPTLENQQQINTNTNKDQKKKSKTIVLESGAPVKSYGDIYKAPEYSQIVDALKKFVTQLKGMNYTPRVVTVKGWADLLVSEGKNSPEYAMRIVNQSIDKGWKALYPLKGYSGEAVSIPSSEDRLAKDAQGNNIVF